MIAIPEGMFHTVPYSEQRTIVTDGSLSYDLAPIRSRECWKSAFPEGDVDWDDGWRKLWQAAQELYGTGTDYHPGRVGVEIEAYFPRDMGGAGIAVNCLYENEDVWESKALERYEAVCRSEQPIAGCIGILAAPGDELARPVLTLLVSGPRGGVDAAETIRLALADVGLNAGVAFRAIKSREVGVVKVPFLPELYLLTGHNSFGINWKLWDKLASLDSESEWSSVLLLWCDAVIAGAERVREDAPLMVDHIYFDFMRTVPLGVHPKTGKEYLSCGSLRELMRRKPSKFLFER